MGIFYFLDLDNGHSIYKYLTPHLQTIPTSLPVFVAMEAGVLHL